MVRYWLFLAVITGSTATAVASIAPGTATDIGNVTVVEKNQNWQPANDLTARKETAPLFQRASENES